VQPGAPPAFDWGGRSTPLDAAPASGARPQTELALAPGATVVFFTDGVFERVDRPLHAGLDHLLELVDRHRALPAGELAEAVTHDALVGRRTTDDVCLLALRWAG
jgi:serine/threonine-protein kinase RsbW